MKSELFRNAFLDMLDSAEFPLKIKSFDEWNCLYQPSTPKKTSLRPDLMIYNTLPKKNNNAIYIESKINAHLTERQLRNYRSNGVKYLVALTKYIPEVSANKINSLDVYRLRWQDFHATIKLILLCGKKFSNQNKFICDQFVKFLEEADMAYNQVLSTKDFTEINKTFIAIAGNCINGIGRLNYRADSIARCSSLLNEIALELLNNIPQLAKAKTWSGYYNIIDDNDDYFHVLQYSLYKKPYNDNIFRWGFWFPKNEKQPIKWYVGYIRKGTEIGEKETGLKKILEKGRVQPDLLAKNVIALAKKWKVSF
jgi:hypothetical protein